MRPKEIEQLLGLKEILRVTRKVIRVSFWLSEALGPWAFSPAPFSALPPDSRGSPTWGVSVPGNLGLEWAGLGWVGRTP